MSYKRLEFLQITFVYGDQFDEVPNSLQEQDQRPSRTKGKDYKSS